MLLRATSRNVNLISATWKLLEATFRYFRPLDKTSVYFRWIWLLIITSVIETVNDEDFHIIFWTDDERLVFVTRWLNQLQLSGV